MDEILVIVLSPGAFAHEIWVCIEGLFRDNKKVHILAIQAEFTNTPQGDLPVLAYCQKLKALANALGDLDNKISDDKLVLTILHGLNECFATIKTIIATKTPFPDFLETRSLLILDEASHA